MLGQGQVTAIVPVVDVERARRFYDEKLGLGPGERTAEGGLLYRAAGGSFVLSPRQEPARNPYTMLTFEVPDVSREVRELEAGASPSRTTTSRTSAPSGTSR